MIDWLIQSTAAHPGLARGIPPAGLLGDQELARFAALKSAKRQRDWLLGRWTAKRLLQAHLAEQAGRWLPLDALVVGSDPDGAPVPSIDLGFLMLDCVPNQKSKIKNLKSLSLSISHSGDHALCALAGGANAVVGADIERIEPRSWQFAEDYFTDDEIRQARLAPADRRDVLITAIWSAKEAALKALRLGLSVDTRSVSCELEASQTVGWAKIRCTCDQRRLGRTTPVLVGWWRRMNHYVLTVAIIDCEPHGFEIIDSTNCTAMLNEVKHLAARQ